MEITPVGRPKSTPKRDLPPPDDAPKKLSRGTGPIFANLDDNQLRRKFHEISRAEKFSEKVAIEALIRYFVESLDKSGRGSLLRNETSLARALELLQWSAHAFTNKRWEWCVRVSLEIVDKCGGMDEILRFGNYRLGFCYLMMAGGIKQELLDSIAGGTPESRESLHIAFDQCAAAGLYYSQRSVEFGEMAIAHYNTSCALVLRAESAALRLVNWSARSEWTASILAAIQSRERTNGRDGQAGGENRRKPPPDPWWKVFAGGWRRYLAEASHVDAGAVSQIDSWLAAAVAELRQTVHLPDQAAVPADVGELVRSSIMDMDLSFLREDSKYKNEFDEWLERNKPSSSRLQSHMMLWSNLKDAQAIEAYIHPGTTKPNNEI